ncbi:hypothetical protein K469DRAFT_729949 [Zopfia rhizophila CBS 207.26]|uniref:Rhodopsin domain-containing protein n=1 Tax=Zopfia rhizophila CBS 207.26 TaxID=1314779 RepID=A0A6A6EL15_9PEZI|nr:hypothetical protein K469DRAFT_729949 [Zopfia rhizophila CBS 207.26]
MLDGAVEILERRRTAPIADRGMIVGVTSWVLLVATIFTVLTRLAMKLAVSKTRYKFGLDDVFIILATLFSVSHTVAVSIEAMHALGQHITTLDRAQIRIFQKTEYASCILYIANLGCARISVCLLIKRILPGKLAKTFAMGFAIFSFIWTIIGVLVTAFPCRLPRPWDFYGNKCYKMTIFVNYVGISNIVVEVLLVLIPLFIWNLRLTAGRRASVSLVFAARLSIVGFLATQLVFFNRFAQNLDFTYNYWRTVLCVQIVQNLSVITACLPCLHPFILSILSGATKPDRLVFECKHKENLMEYLRKKNPRFDSTRSSSSTMPMKNSHYVAPLATYGLDRSSAHLHSQHFNRFPTNVATPVDGPNAPENVFNRSVEIPRSRPITSASQKELPPLPPKSLSQVGVLPVVDWDTDSDRDSARSSPSRNRTSDYIFSREKVISVPEAKKLYEEGYWRRYPPPPEN